MTETPYAPPPTASSPQPEYYPINLTVDYPQTSSRPLAIFSIPFFFLRGLLLIPVLFCLYFVGLAALVVVWLAFWAVAFTGRYPAGMFDFAAGSLRWQARASGYMFGLTDKYPPFRLRA